MCFNIGKALQGFTEGTSKEHNIFSSNSWLYRFFNFSPDQSIFADINYAAGDIIVRQKQMTHCSWKDSFLPFLSKTKSKQLPEVTLSSPFCTWHHTEIKKQMILVSSKESTRTVANNLKIFRFIKVQKIARKSQLLFLRTQGDAKQ